MSLSPLYLGLTSDLHVSIAFERPPRFPLASFGPGKARYLSGPIKCAQLQIPFTEDQDRALLPAPSLSVMHSQASLSLRVLVCHHNTRTFGRLLGPCFKTGGEPTASRLRPTFLTALTRQKTMNAGPRKDQRFSRHLPNEAQTWAVGSIRSPPRSLWRSIYQLQAAGSNVSGKRRSPWPTVPPR